MKNSLNSNHIDMSSENPKIDDESSETGTSSHASSTTVPLPAVASSSIASSPPPAIFKLNVDCLHNIFEWISLTDLISIAGTCKRLHQAAGDFFRWNSVSREITIRNGSIYIPFREVNIFIEYIPRISITCTSMRLNRLIGEKCKSLRHIRLMGSLLEDRIEHLKGILKHVEMIDMVECPNREEFFDFFLQHCSNVKSLSVQRSGKIRNNVIIVGCNNDWMLRTHPTLKYFELLDAYELRNNELLTFFQKNPQVRTFSTDSYSLCENRNTFLTGDIQLDRLAIEFTTESMAAETIDLLNELYERGFFKRLHVYVPYHARTYIERILLMPLASNALEMFHGSFKGIPQPLKNLKILGITYFQDNNSLSATDIPRYLPNLERIYLAQCRVDHILPFIRNAANLKAIKIKHFADFKNLMVLNHERKRLDDPKKLTIYINEYFVEMHKWGGKPSKCSLMELRRYEACEWNDLNAKHRYYKLQYN